MPFGFATHYRFSDGAYATHAQKGLPAFGIYGHDVQEADDTSIPEDVKEKLLRFGRAAVAAASMRGKSYLQIGSVTMGIGGSIIDSDFIESYLGMRVESVDEASGWKPPWSRPRRPLPRGRRRSTP